MDGAQAPLSDRVLAACGALVRKTRRVLGVPFGTPLTSAEVELVRHVRRTPECSVAEAANALGLAPNTVSTLVRALTDRTVLHRRADPRDRRVVRLELTPEADRRLAGWRDSRSASVAAAIARLSPHDRNVLEHAVPILAALADDLTTTTPESTTHEEAAS